MAPAPVCGHVVPFDHQGVFQLPLHRNLWERPLEGRGDGTQDVWTGGLPEGDLPLAGPSFQVPQENGQHLEAGGRLAQVGSLGWGLARRHKAVGVDLEERDGGQGEGSYWWWEGWGWWR